MTPVESLRSAAADALAGWRYIRAHHGDLYGVAWDRVESALTDALAQVDGHPQGGDGTAPFMTSAVGTEGTDAFLPLSQSITPPEVGGELVERLLALIEARQMAGIVEDGERVGTAARRFHHASLAVAEFIGANWPTIIAALSTPEVVDGTAGLVEALEKIAKNGCFYCAPTARAALAQHRGVS